MKDHNLRSGGSNHHHSQRHIHNTQSTAYRTSQRNLNRQNLNYRLISSQNAVPMIGMNISINPSSQQARQATGFIPSTIIPGLTQNRNRFIKSQHVPQDIYIQTVYPQNQPYPISMILPIDRQIGQILNGKCLKYSQKPITIHKANDNILNQYMKTKDNRISQKLKQKLLQSPVQRTISGYLYVADINDQYRRQTKQQYYMSLLNEKQNQLIAKQKTIQNMSRRLKGVDEQILKINNHKNFLEHQLGVKNRMLQQKGGYHHEQSIKRNQQIQRLIRQLQKAKQGSQSFKNIDLIINNQTKECSPAQTVVFKWIHGLSNGRVLKELIRIYQSYQEYQRRFNDMENKFNAASTIYASQLQTLKKDNPLLLVNINEQILKILNTQNTAIRTTQSVIQVQKIIQKTIEVPVQDERTKNLIKLLTVQLKNIYNRHPKLLDNIDGRLAQYFSQQMINQIDMDTFDRVVSVIKYVPQVVRVENVYTECQHKSKKVQFHLRVLLKTLLQSIQKLKAASSLTLELDQNVIEMIKNQIMDIVNVDDILKVFQVNKKVVEVEKIIQRIVDRIVQVPVPMHQSITNQIAVPLRKPEVYENRIHVGCEVPSITHLKMEKLVKQLDVREIPMFVPTVINNVIQCVKQVPKIVQVVVEKQVPIRVVEICQVPQMIRQVPIYRDIVKQIIRQVPIIQQRTIECIKQVPRYEQKLVKQREQIIKIVEIPKLQIVNEVKIITQTHNYIQTKYQPVQLIVEKAISVPVIHERIVHVPQIVEKIVKCSQPYEVLKIIEVDRPVIIHEQKIKEVQVPVHHVMEKQVEKIIQKVVQVPCYQQTVKVQIQHHIVPQQVHTKQIIHQQVQLQKPVILYQDKIIQFDKIIPHIMREQVPVRFTEQKIIQCIKQIERIHTVRLLQEKIVQKIVQVPKVIEIQKIVQKIVIVPRIIEKIVEVPKIVQVPVENTVIIEKIVEVIRIVQKPCIVEVERIIQVPVNHYIQTQVPVQVKEQIMVVDSKQIHTTQIRQICTDRIVVQTRQVPKILQVQKIIPLIHEVPKFIQNQLIVPIQIQKPQYIYVKQPIPVNNTIVNIISEDRVVEKIVQYQIEVPKLVECEVIREVLKIEEIYKEIKQYIPAVRDVLKQIQGPTKIVQRIKQKCIEVPVMIDKIITVNEIIREPQFHQIIKQIPIMVPQLKIIRELVPKIIEVPRIIELLIDKIIQVPYQLQRLKQVFIQKEKIVHTQGPLQQRIRQVHLETEKQVILERLIKCTDTIHQVQQAMKIVEARHVTEKSVLVTKQKIIQVPFIVQQIVQKIILMPQVVQILKYVHEVCENECLDGQCTAEVGQQQTKYKLLGKNIQSHIQTLLHELKSIRSVSNKHHIQTLQKFLIQFKPLLAISRFNQMIRERQVEIHVEKDRVVHMPGDQTMNSLSKLTVIEHLISEFKRLKKINPSIKLQLPSEINDLFINSDKSLDQSLSQHRNVLGKMFDRDQWNQDQKKIFEKFLEERYQLASELKSTKKDNKQYHNQIKKKKQQVDKLNKQRDFLADTLKTIFKAFDFDNQRQFDLGDIIGNLTNILQNRERQLSLLYNHDLGSLTKQHGEVLLNLLGRSMPEKAIIPSHWDNNLKIKYDSFWTVMREFYHKLPYVFNQHEQIAKLFDHIVPANANQNQHVIRQQENQISKLRREIMQFSTTKKVVQQRPSIVIHQINHDKCHRKIDQLSDQIQRLKEIQYQHKRCAQNVQLLQRNIQSLQQIERQYRTSQHTTQKISPLTTVLETKIRQLQRQINRLLVIQEDHRNCRRMQSQIINLEASNRLYLQKNSELEHLLRDCQRQRQQLQMQIARMKNQIVILKSPRTTVSPIRQHTVEQQRRTELYIKSNDDQSQSSHSSYGVQYMNYYANQQDTENIGVTDNQVKGNIQTTRSVYQEHLRPSTSSRGGSYIEKEQQQRQEYGQRVSHYSSKDQNRHSHYEFKSGTYQSGTYQSGLSKNSQTGFNNPKYISKR